MSNRRISRSRVEKVLTKTSLTSCFRVIPKQFLKTPLGVSRGDSRFVSSEDGYRVLYAAPEFATALIETVLRDRFVHKSKRQLRLPEITERAWVSVSTKPAAELNLLDLRGDGCLILGVPTDSINARNHAAGRSLGRTIHADHEEVDGIIYTSRLTGTDAFAIYDRVIDKLVAQDSGFLENHPELPELLETQEIFLISSWL